MQSFGLLCLIEKFAEIHRQVSIRSLTTISWRAFVCFSGLNPFQLQNAPHSALKLHLDIAGKMQSLGLSRLIEKFAEIHRQVSIRSLTIICLRAFVCFFGLNPFQLQNASHSALKLHFLFLNGVTLGCRPNPSREHSSLHPFSAARGSQARNQKIVYSFFSYCFSIDSICALAAFCAS